MTTKDRATSVPDDTQKTRTDREKIADTAGDEDENPSDISPLSAKGGGTAGSRKRSRDENGTKVQENGASLPDEERGGGNKRTATERPSSGALFSGDRERPTKGGGGPSRRRGKNQSRSTSPSNRKRQSKKRPPPQSPSENTGVGPPQERLSARNAANPSAGGNRGGNPGAEAGDSAATASKQNSSGSRRRHRHRHSRYRRRHRPADARREGGRKRGVRGAGGGGLTTHRPRDYSPARKSGFARLVNHGRGRRDLDPFRGDENLQETRGSGFSSSLWKRPPLTATNPYAALFGGEEKLNRIVWNSPESTATRDSVIQGNPEYHGNPESPEISRAARRARRQLRRAAAHSQDTLIPGLSAEQDIMLSPAETDLRRIDILSRDCDHVRGSGGGRSAADAALDSTKQVAEGRKSGKRVLTFGDPAKKSADGAEDERGDDAKEQRTRRELRNLFGAPNITYRCSPFHKHWLFTSRWVRRPFQTHTHSREASGRT